MYKVRNVRNQNFVLIHVPVMKGFSLLLCGSKDDSLKFRSCCHALGRMNARECSYISMFPALFPRKQNHVTNTVLLSEVKKKNQTKNPTPQNIKLHKGNDVLV